MLDPLTRLADALAAADTARAAGLDALATLASSYGHTD